MVSKRKLTVLLNILFLVFLRQASTENDDYFFSVTRFADIERFYSKVKKQSTCVICMLWLTFTDKIRLTLCRSFFELGLVCKKGRGKLILITSYSQKFASVWCLMSFSHQVTHNFNIGEYPHTPCECVTETVIRRRHSKGAPFHFWEEPAKKYLACLSLNVALDFLYLITSSIRRRKYLIQASSWWPMVFWNFTIYSQIWTRRNK